jgi:hypothetical protein
MQANLNNLVAQRPDIARKFSSFLLEAQTFRSTAGNKTPLRLPGNL